MISALRYVSCECDEKLGDRARSHPFHPLVATRVARGRRLKKHDSFISSTPDGRVIMEFLGKELIRGEPDASSFPSGGLRSSLRRVDIQLKGTRPLTRSSRTVIPVHPYSLLFVSAAKRFDKKTPLLRSMETLNDQALRILRLFGNTQVKRVLTTVGPEQEYFLIDREMYEKRRDLKYCNRTLFGAKPPKGQEMDDHYFGSIRPRVFRIQVERA